MPPVKNNRHATCYKQQGQAPDPINCLIYVHQHTFTKILQQKHTFLTKIAHGMYMTGTTFQAIELFGQ
jgi:hypothetical protein